MFPNVRHPSLLPDGIQTHAPQLFGVPSLPFFCQPELSPYQHLPRLVPHNAECPVHSPSPQPDAHSNHYKPLANPSLYSKARTRSTIVLKQNQKQVR